MPITVQRIFMSGTTTPEAPPKKSPPNNPPRPKPSTPAPSKPSKEPPTVPVPVPKRRERPDNDPGVCPP